MTKYVNYAKHNFILHTIYILIQISQSVFRSAKETYKYVILIPILITII